MNNDNNMKIVMVGEAWGFRESQMQYPLVGPSGRELTLEIGISNLAPYMTILCRKCKTPTQFITPRCEHCKEYLWPNEFNLIDYWKLLRADHSIAVTNVFNEHPPNICASCGSLHVSTFGKPTCLDCKSSNIRTNDLGWFFGTEIETKMPSWKASKRSGGSHLKSRHFHHIKRLWRELEDLSPNLIVALGNAACWATLGQTKITALRGTVSRSNTDLTGLDIKVLPTFHPAAVLRQMPMRVSVIADLRKASREAKFPEIRRPKRWITIPAPVESGLQEGYDWFKKPASAYAVDIETRKGQITMVGFARANDDALVIPIRNEDGTPYWPTEELEFLAWKLIIFGVETPIPKIFQNGIFDISYFMRIGIHPRNATHDTMLFHHSEFIELPKSLGYLGSIYSSEVAWKTMVRHQDSLKRDE